MVILAKSDYVVHDISCMTKGDNSYVTSVYSIPHSFSCTVIYHCVFGDLEESLQSCCRKALEKASQDELTNVAFWVDGFASLSGQHKVILYINVA